MSPPIATETLIEHCLGNSACALALMDEFASSSRVQVAQLARLVADCDFQAVAGFGHALRGAAGIISAERLSGLAADLETAARAEDVDEIASMAAHVQIEIERCLQEITFVRRKVQFRSSMSPVR